MYEFIEFPKMLYRGDDYMIVNSAEEEAAAVGFRPHGADPLDHDGDGRRGGRKPNKIPALTGKSKAELLAIASDEGVEASDEMTMPEIRQAIEDARK